MRKKYGFKDNILQLIKCVPVTHLFIANAVLIFKFSNKKSKAREKSFSQYLTAFTEYLLFTEYSALTFYPIFKVLIIQQDTHTHNKP